MMNPEFAGLTIAVAPAVNQCGSTAFDPDHFADEMANELGYVDGVNVVPVSRVKDVMRQRGWTQVDRVGQARDLAAALEADAVLVFAVTAYDPYKPPKIGLTAQLLGERAEALPRVNPVTLSRQPAATEAQGAQGTGWVLAQASRVFDASHTDCLEDVKEFARHRDAGNNPYGYRVYVVSQRRFMQYCCNATLRLLFDGKEGITAHARASERSPVPEERRRASR